MELDREISRIEVSEVEIGDRTRSLNEAKVDELVSSILVSGLMNPIWVSCVRDEDGRPVGYRLISGNHRLAAAKKLDWEFIDARIVDCDEREARLMEISENLHRAELTVGERADQIAEWISLTTPTPSEVSTQVVSNPQGGRPEGGVRAAARELGVNREEARRAVRIASIAPEAREAAREAGLDDDQSALLRVAAAAPETQVQVVAGIVKAKAEKAKTTKADRAAKQAANLAQLRKCQAQAAEAAHIGEAEEYLDARQDEELAEINAHYATLALAPVAVEAVAGIVEAKAEKAKRKAPLIVLDASEYAVESDTPGPTLEQYRFAYFNRANDAAKFAMWPDAGHAPDQEMLEWADLVIEKWTELRSKFASVLQPPTVVEVVAGIEPTDGEDDLSPGKLDVAALLKPLLAPTIIKPKAKAVEFAVLKPAPKNKRSKIGEVRQATPEAIAAYNAKLAEAA